MATEIALNTVIISCRGAKGSELLEPVQVSLRDTAYLDHGLPKTERAITCPFTEVVRIQEPGQRTPATRSVRLVCNAGENISLSPDQRPLCFQKFPI